MAASRRRDAEARWREVRAELLRQNREQADGLEEIRLFARLSAETAAVLRRRSRRRRGGERPRGTAAQAWHGV